jgi:6,7-dimethyl-8-ribityllumazine synthase
MASKLKKLGEGKQIIEYKNNYKIAIVVSEYYLEEINAKLLNACMNILVNNNIKATNIYIEYVPGAFELTACAQIMFEKYHPDAVITLGCVIKGDTDHDKYINHAVSQGITMLSIQYKKPFIFGLLTPNTMKQALERSGGKHGNKGAEVAEACLKMIDLAHKLK